MARLLFKFVEPIPLKPWPSIFHILISRYFEFTCTSLKFWCSQLSFSSPWEWFHLCRKWDRDPIPTWLISSCSTICRAAHSFFTDCYQFSHVPSFPKGIALFLGSLLGSTTWLFFPCPTPHCLNYSSSLYLLSEMASPLSLFICQTVLVLYSFITILAYIWFALLTRIVEAINWSIFGTIGHFSAFFFLFISLYSPPPTLSSPHPLYSPPLPFLPPTLSPCFCASALKHLVNGFWNS